MTFTSALATVIF